MSKDEILMECPIFWDGVYFYLISFFYRLIWAYIVCLLFSTLFVTLVNITVNINFIPMLNCSNFKSWQENLLIFLVAMDLNLALRVDCFPSLTDESILNDKRNIKWWEKSNHMYMMIMKKLFWKHPGALCLER